MYDQQMVQPMRDELTAAGVTELRTRGDVDGVLAREGRTTLIFVNSVCGCAAGTARPGLIKALGHEVLPDNVTSVFAGVDQDAVSHARSKFTDHQPSSPSVALFRDGELVDMVERHDIEIRSAEQLAARLTQAFDKFCGAEIDESIEIADPLANIEISCAEVQAMVKEGIDFKFLDVRTEGERAIASIPDTILVTQETVNEIMESWPKDTKIVFHRHHGPRSQQAAEHFAALGFTDLHNVVGGIDAWSQFVDPAVPRY